MIAHRGVVVLHRLPGLERGRGRHVGDLRGRAARLKLPGLRGSIAHQARVGVRVGGLLPILRPVGQVGVDERTGLALTDQVHVLERDLLDPIPPTGKANVVIVPGARTAIPCTLEGR